jgi:hypothetical protein
MLSPQKMLFPALPSIACLAKTWLRPSAVMLTACLGTWACAQSLSPTELAAKALASPSVRALSQPDAAALPSKQALQKKEHEAQLTAIRQAILDATLDRPTRVISSAWVDDKGALHEAAHFHSEAQVRGVRVLSYVQGDEPQTQISAEVLPWGWKPVGTDQSCQVPPNPWRLPLAIQALDLSGFSGPQQFASQTLLGMAQQAWTNQLQTSQRWRPKTLAPSPAPEVDNPYMRALMMGQNDERSGWVAELSLQPHAPATTPPLASAERTQASNLPEWRWTLHLKLGQKNHAGSSLQTQWHMTQAISVAPLDLGKSPTNWAQSLQAALQDHMRHWVTLLDKQTECEPVQFHVRHNASLGLELQAGLDSGLRPGDRVLLMNPQHVPSRMLEPSVAQHLALAQVVKVGTNRTELQQLAGPALASKGPWMALPL